MIYIYIIYLFISLSSLIVLPVLCWNNSCESRHPCVVLVLNKKYLVLHHYYIGCQFIVDALHKVEVKSFVKCYKIFNLRYCQFSLKRGCFSLYFYLEWLHIVNWWFLVPIKPQQESPVWSVVKKTLFRANSSTVPHTVQLYKQLGCEVALGPGPTSTRQLCSPENWSASLLQRLFCSGRTSVFQLS